MLIRITTLFLALCISSSFVYASPEQQMKNIKQEQAKDIAVKNHKGKKTPAGKELSAYIKQQKSKGIKGQELADSIASKRSELGMKPKKGGAKG